MFNGIFETSRIRQTIMRFDTIFCPNKIFADLEIAAITSAYLKVLPCTEGELRHSEKYGNRHHILPETSGRHSIIDTPTFTSII